MRRHIARAARSARREFEKGNGGLWRSLVNWLTYMDELASSIGCRPSPSLLLSDPRLAWRLMFGASTGAQYRLSGVGARAKLARSALFALPLSARLHDQLYHAALFFLTAPIALLAWAFDWDNGARATLL